MIGRLNHVAIAVPDLEAASAQYRDALGAKVGAPQDEPDHGAKRHRHEMHASVVNDDDTKPNNKA